MYGINLDLSVGRLARSLDKQTKTSNLEPVGARCESVTYP
jgi:hypothetical protein